MMVIISTSPAMKYSMAVCSPPKINQMMLPNIFMFVLFQSLSIRRRIEAKSCRSSYNIQGYRGARLGIGQGVVMVLEVIATGGGNCVKLVIRQRMARKVTMLITIR